MLSEWKYGQPAVRTNALVTDKRLHPATDTSDTAYELSYQVEVEGQSFAHIFYTPAVPARNRLNAPQPWMFKTLMAFLACLITGLGATFIVRAIRGARREWQSAPSAPSRQE